MHGTIDPIVINKLLQKNTEIIFIINKIDTLPSHSVDSVIRNRVKEILKTTLTEEIGKMFFISSKTGKGIE